MIEILLLYLSISVSVSNTYTYLRSKLDEASQIVISITNDILLHGEQIEKAGTQIVQLTTKIEGVRVRHEAAELHNNLIFMNHLQMELATMKRVRCIYGRFVAMKMNDELHESMDAWEDEVN